MPPDDIDLRARIPVQRGVAPARQSSGHFEFGTAEVDITPHPDIPMAGYSLSSQRAQGVHGHLFARVLYLRDARGEDAAIVVIDMHSASRLLLELTAARTVASRGLGVDRILLHGTHAHNAPGGFYGNSLYDHFSTTPGFDKGLVTWIANRIAAGIEHAHDHAERGGIAFDERKLWGYSRNRSREAFDNNAARMTAPDRDAWLNQGPWANPGPGANHADEKFVDPRILTLVARHDGAAAPAAVFAFFACHPTTFGVKSEVYTPDWPAFAAQTARIRLFTEYGGADPDFDPVIAVGTRAHGDLNGLRYDIDDPLDPGPALAERVGSAVGAQVADGAIAATPNAATVEVTPWFAEPAIDDPVWRAAARPQLAERWFYGPPTISGSEETDVGLLQCLVHEGDPGDELDADDPQSPKKRFLSFGQGFLQFFLSLDTCPVHPLLALKLGDTMLVGLPGEPTIGAGHVVERALLDATGAQRVAVLPCCGDYGGYLATESEYLLQHYEGSSTLYGRHSLAYLRERLLEMVGQAPVPAAAGTIVFTTISSADRFDPQDDIEAVDPDPRWVISGDQRLEFRWLMHRKARVVFGNSPWIRVTQQADNGTWHDVTVAGRVLDDRNYPIRIERLSGSVDGLRPWRARIDLPITLPAKPTRVVVSPRAGFPGFVLDV